MSLNKNTIQPGLPDKNMELLVHAHYFKMLLYSAIHHSFEKNPGVGMTKTQRPANPEKRRSYFITDMFLVQPGGLETSTCSIRSQCWTLYHFLKAEQLHRKLING